MVQCKQYQVQVTKALSIKQFAKVPVRKGVDIPQADYIDKVVQFVVKIFEGFDTKDKIRAAFGGVLVTRQINYYRQAAEILGLIRKYGEYYELTDISKDYLGLPAELRLEVHHPKAFDDISKRKRCIYNRTSIRLRRTMGYE
jgi:hypothetical protein